MAILKVPRITTSLRQNLLLQSSEITFDTDQNIFYGGDGNTLGGFPIGQGVQTSIAPQIVSLTQSIINDKFIVLNNTPLVPEAITVAPAGGPQQLYGIDYEIQGNILTWNGLGLDGILDDSDKLIIRY